MPHRVPGSPQPGPSSYAPSHVSLTTSVSNSLLPHHLT
jgi:hypothetical protein